MMISEPNRIATPKAVRGNLGTEPSADADIGEKPLNGGGGDARHPVDRVYGILGKPGDTDEYLEEIRGR